MQRKYKAFIYFLAVAAFVYMSCYTTFATGDANGNEGGALTVSDVISVPESIPDPVLSEFVSEPESIPDTISSEVTSQVVSVPDSTYSSQDSSITYYEPTPTYSYSDNVVASLYDVSTVIDTNEMDAKDWNIVLDLESNTGKNENIGLSDFNFIKDETNKTAGEDDSTWILYVGYTLVALGLAGILYVIVSTIYRIKHKDKYDKMLKARKAEGKQLKKSAASGKKALKAGRYSS